MPNNRHPGVYIEEISQPAPIQGVSTSTAGFVGITEKGEDPSGDNRGLYNQPVLISGWNHFFKTYGGIVWNRFLAPAVYSFFKKGGTQCYVVRLGQESAEKGKVAIDGLGTVTATTPGAWSDEIGISISNSPSGVSGDAETPAFTLSVVYTESLGKNPVFDNYIKINSISNTGTSERPVYVLESFGGLSVPFLSEGASAAEMEGVWAGVVSRIASQSLFIRLIAEIESPARPHNTARPKGLSGGTDADIDYGTEENRTGFYAFHCLEDNAVNLLALPDLSTFVTSAGEGAVYQAQARVVRDAAIYCERKKTMFLVADAPFGLSVAEMQAYKGGAASGKVAATNVSLNHDYGAIYYPWISMNMPGTTKNIMIPPSGPVTGVYAATDALVGVYKAPAGIYDGNIPFALDLERTVTDSDQDVLNPHGINAIRLLPVYGVCVWGARTLAVDSESPYINVRRWLIYMEASIRQGCRWTVSEPNNPKLWGTVMRNTKAFLTAQWQQGALFGSTAEEAFFVKIDEENNPRELREKGMMHIDIGVALVYPAEFTIVSIRQKTLPATG